MNDRRNDDFKQHARDEVKRLLIPRLTADLEKVDVALARPCPVDRAADETVNCGFRASVRP